jgi:hypothetical protein
LGLLELLLKGLDLLIGLVLFHLVTGSLLLQLRLGLAQLLPQLRQELLLLSPASRTTHIQRSFRLSQCERGPAPMPAVLRPLGPLEDDHEQPHQHGGREARPNQHGSPVPALAIAARSYPSWGSSGRPPR